MSPNENSKQKAQKQSMEQYQSPSEDAVKPPREEDSSEDVRLETFDAPDDTFSAAENAAATEAQSFGEGAPSRDLLDVKAQIQAMLLGNATNGAQSAESLREEDNIVGVGIGSGVGSGASSLYAGIVPGEPALVVFVKQLASLDAVKSAVSDSIGASALDQDSFPIEIIETGVIEAQANTARVRPAPGGYSVGHYKITAGTIGCFGTGNSAPRNARMLVLSNNHVLANVNAGVYGDCIVQPGPYDGGKCPPDQIAILERFVPINFAAGASNTVDCATGWTWHDRVRRDLAYQSGATVVYFRINSTPIAPTVGMIVGKTGRTTGLTVGRITAIGVAVNVNYGGGRVAHFVDQMSIQSVNTTPFSAGGDSGSSIWTWNAVRNPVGLLFAGGGGVTFANRMTSVVRALDIHLLT
jgi:hypothetical protein